MLEGPGGEEQDLALEVDAPCPAEWPEPLAPGRYTLRVESWVPSKGEHGDRVCIREIVPLTVPDCDLVELWGLLKD